MFSFLLYIIFLNFQKCQSFSNVNFHKKRHFILSDLTKNALQYFRSGDKTVPVFSSGMPLFLGIPLNLAFFPENR